MTDQIDVENKANPRLRVSDLNDNSTRYDQIAAAPSDETLTYYWYTWAAVTLISGLFCFLVFLSILVNKKIRRKPFNLYLLFLLVPDLVFSISCGTTCLLNALEGHYYSKLMCNVQQWYCVFGIGGSAWINGIIAYQVHSMLKDSHARRRYRVPTNRRVTIQCVTAYAWVIFLGSWGVYEVSNFPYHSGLISGLACLPTEVDQPSSIFFWLAFAPLFVGIPTVYAIWVFFDIHRRKLMPPTGKRRLLSIYFGRLFLVFCVMWIPSILLIFVFPSFTPVWVSFFGGTWSHMQTLFSAAIICMKPDMRVALTDLVLCRRLRKRSRGDQDDMSSSQLPTSETRNSQGSQAKWEKSFMFRASNVSMCMSSSELGIGKNRSDRSMRETTNCATASSAENFDASQDICVDSKHVIGDKE